MRTSRNRNGKKISLPSVLIVTVFVLSAAVYSGYLGAKYIVEPFFFSGQMYDQGQQDENSNEQEENSPEGESSGKTAEEERKDQTGSHQEIVMLYTLKFGTYSSLENAEKAVEALAQKNIYGYQVESGVQYKIYSLPFTDKDRATQFKEGYLAMGEDCFVVPRQFTVKEGFKAEFVKEYVDIIEEISSQAYSGQQRIDMVVSRLEDLEQRYSTQQDQTGAFTERIREQAAAVTGTENQILFQLQKTIIMNLSDALEG